MIGAIALESENEKGKIRNPFVVSSKIGELIIGIYLIQKLGINIFSDAEDEWINEIKTRELENHTGVVISKRETKIPAGKTILLNGKTEGETPMKYRKLLMEAIQTENGGIQEKGIAIHSGVYGQDPDKKIRIRMSNKTEEELTINANELCVVFDSLVQEPADQHRTESKKIDIEVETVRNSPLPPRLKNKSAEEMKIALRGLTFVKKICDDLLIISKTRADHFVHLRSVFRTIRPFGIKLASDKCKLFQIHIELLGYKIDKTGIKPEKYKLEVMRNMQPPRTIKEIRQTLGFFNFLQNVCTKLLIS